jgi:hypothetical protein
MFTPPMTRGRDVGASVRSTWFTMVGRRRRDQRGQAEPAAYCVSGRHPMVIVTTGALRALDAGQLDAVWRMHELTLPAFTPAAWPGRTAGPVAPSVVRATAATLALAPVLLALAPAAAALALGRVPAI